MVAEIVVDRLSVLLAVVVATSSGSLLAVSPSLTLISCPVDLSIVRPGVTVDVEYSETADKVQVA